MVEINYLLFLDTVSPAFIALQLAVFFKHILVRSTKVVPCLLSKLTVKEIKRNKRVKEYKRKKTAMKVIKEIKTEMSTKFSLFYFYQVSLYHLHVS